MRDTRYGFDIMSQNRTEKQEIFPNCTRAEADPGF